jgi:hypothetical protein
MTLRDQDNGSKFEVGGRMYFEVHAFAMGFISFTTNGFFDKEGYVEPQMSATQIALGNLTWLWIVIGVIGVAMALCLYCYCKNKKKVDDSDHSRLKKHSNKTNEDKLIIEN